MEVPSTTPPGEGQAAVGEIELAGVSKLYRGTKRDDIWALQDVDLKCASGEFVSLLGASGCGKSTLLNIVAGFEKATAGTVKLDGREVTSPGPDRGFVFQEYAIFPWLTAVDNVRFGLHGRGLSKREQIDRANELLELVDLAGSGQKLPHELSGGMQQRVAIARVLSIEPKVLLMDEPFGALDAQTRAMMQDEFVRIWASTRRTVIFVTHSVEEAVLMADRIVLIAGRPGRVVESVRVELLRPRDATSTAFAEVRRHVASILQPRTVKAGG